jgi:hypothetical protein
MSTEKRPSKTTRRRVLGYPAMTLSEAIEKTRALWTLMGRTPMRVETAANCWGYALTSSGWRVGLAALRHFGLIGPAGHKRSGHFKVSSLAVTLLNDDRAEPTERARAIKKAALRPRLYRELWAAWNGQLPSSDAVMSEFLICHIGLSKRVVGVFVKDLRETVQFADLTEADVMRPHEETDESNADDFGALPLDGSDAGFRANERRSLPLGMNEDVFTLAEGTVVLQWPQRLSRESYIDFEQWLLLIARKAQRSIVDHASSDQFAMEANRPRIPDEPHSDLADEC